MEAHQRAGASIPTCCGNTAASHSRQAVVDLITIRRWLGRARVSTSIHAAVDLESKRKAVRKAKPLLNTETGSSDWRTDADTLSWMESL
ncbi:MAG: hypothetical protein OXH99_13465 [Bryobacterales bacterium]|nr:hypothetical protein [Bryobacterales bacterium]